jgi:hypothetical protein
MFCSITLYALRLSFASIIRKACVYFVYLVCFLCSYVRAQKMRSERIRKVRPSVREINSLPRLAISARSARYHIMLHVNLTVPVDHVGCTVCLPLDPLHLSLLCALRYCQKGERHALSRKGCCLSTPREMERKGGEGEQHPATR